MEFWRWAMMTTTMWNLHVGFLWHFCHFKHFMHMQMQFDCRMIRKNFDQIQSTYHVAPVPFVYMTSFVKHVHQSPHLHWETSRALQSSPWLGKQGDKILLSNRNWTCSFLHAHVSLHSFFQRKKGCRSWSIIWFELIWYTSMRLRS